MGKNKEYSELLDKWRLDDEKLKRKLREDYALKLIWLLLIWILTLLVFLFLKGFSLGMGIHSFNLSDDVVIVLIYTTTANVFGLFHIVTTYIFAKSK
tara:strand:- start:271 stop:561 length:291 start_codon:yes stop_codon:yes gene_type:complete